MEYSSAVAPMKSDQSQQVMRPLAHPPPDVWGDFFLNYTPPPLKTQLYMEEELDKLKEEVRKKLLTNVADDPKERITYIDIMERLGVAYHFEEEIEAILQQFYDGYNEHGDLYRNDLHYVSLRFRILRQHGFFVSPDVFEKFKGEDGSFKESIIRDVEGILNLYEASYLRVHGEKILDETNEFARTQLKLLLETLREPLATRVSEALKLPLHRNIPKLLSKYYMETYEANPAHDKTLLRFAKIDFNLVRVLYLKELRDLSRWWKSLDITTKLPFEIRDRIVEAYCWAVWMLPQPKYASARVATTKSWKVMSIMDDMFDSYGLFEELKLYREAIRRWDKRCTNQLPDYMKVVYENYLDTVDGVEHDVAEEGTSHLIPFYREAMIALCESYMKEATLLHENLVPTYEEYMEEVGIGTGGATVICAGPFLGMGEIANEELFKWINQTPKPIKASSVIARVLNDIAGYKIEKQRYHVASTIDCLMAQYGILEEDAVAELYKKVEEAWKDVNEEMFRPTKIPRPLLSLILNMVRGLEVLYRSGVDEYATANESMCDKVRTLFMDPVTV